MLYNIARDYERLSEPRNAADYYQRYLDEAPDAADRAAVESRIATLRARKSEISVIATPAGAAVFVDGARAGEAPLTLSLDAGSHEAYVAHQGRTSRVKAFTVEYGEPQTLRFDLEGRAGYLVIASNVDGAEVRLDGELIGRTPFSGPVPAGNHQIVITRAGYETAQREIEIHPSGSEQIRTDLARIEGAPEPPKPPPPRRYLFGIGWGYDAVDEAARYTLDIGVRSRSERLEGTLVTSLGSRLPSGGLAGRFYLSGSSRLRPYLRAAGLVIWDTSATIGGRMFGVEGGAGVLLPMQTRAYRLDAYLELDVQTIVAGLPADPMDGSDAKNRTTAPVSLGIIWSWSMSHAR